MKNKFVMACAGLLLAGCSGSHMVSSVQKIDKLPNVGNRGSTIQVELETGKSVTGVLLAVGDTSFAVYSGPLGGANDTLFFARNLHIIKKAETKSLVIKSAPRGISPTIIGLGIGGAFGLFSSLGAKEDETGGGYLHSRGQKTGFAVAGFGILGAAAGSIAGAAGSKPDLTVPHPDEQHWDALRRLARFPEVKPGDLNGVR